MDDAKESRLLALAYDVVYDRGIQKPCSWNRAVLEGKVAMVHCQHLLTKLDALLSETEFYRIVPYGLQNVSSLADSVPIRIFDIVYEVCAAFAAFSNWSLVRDDNPSNYVYWKALLINHLRTRLFIFTCTNGAYVVHWYRLHWQGMWKRVFKLFCVIRFWVHLANKPDSSGYRSGLAYLQDTVLLT